MKVRVGVLTVSDKGSAGRREDTSGARLKELVLERGWTIEESAVIPDDAAAISVALARWCDDGKLDLVLTTGGTGVGPRDVTPEATRRVLDREIPGLGELMRRDGFQKNPMAALSRSMAGFRGLVLIVNLPGSPRGAEESLLSEIYGRPHALEVARGASHDPPEQEESPIDLAL